MQEARLPRRISKSRALFVVDRTRMYSELDYQGVAYYEDFAATAEETAHTKSREMTDHLAGDERKLTTHASHIRSVGANIVLLRDGIVPALKLDPDNPVLQIYAKNAFAFIRGEFDAMDLLVE